MGIFTKISKTDDQEKINDFFRKLNNSKDETLKDLADKMDDIRKNPSMQVIKPFSLYVDILEMIMSNNADFSKYHYFDLVLEAEKIYKDIFTYDEETPDFENLCLVFLELFDENSAIKRKCFNVKFFNLFNNKLNYIKWLKSINQQANVLLVENHYISYGLKARSFFADEDMFTANIIDVTEKLLCAVNPKLVIDAETKNIEHMAGIYNVDESLILNAEQHIDMAEKILDRSSELLETANKRLEVIDSVSKNTVDNVKRLCDTELEIAKATLSDIDIKLKDAYNEFAENQNNIILYEKQQLLNSVFAEAESKLKEIKNMAMMAVNSANLELIKINQQSGDVVAKIENYVNNDEKISKLVNDAKANEELINKIDKLMIINDQNIDQISRNMAVNGGVSNQAAGGATGASVNDIYASGNRAAAKDNWDDEEIPTVSPLLDENISFKERYNTIMKAKEKLELKGEHFHKMFDDVLIAVLENANPYLIGPSGCGKTYMVSQLARLLNLDFIDIGYINEEYDILGFQTANGGYSRPNFYRCYKYGKIAFCDELDNGNSRATVKLNSFLSNTEDASYSFPNGENVKRHKNFRMIAAGNTTGNGADSNYNTREKIEESVQQRLTPIFIDYDNNVEKAILKDYEEWYEFVVLFRNATTAYEKNSYGGAPGIITTRDVTRIKKYLDHGSYTMDKILDYEFIQTKESSYLAFLDNHMKSNIDPHSKAKEILKKFSEKVEAIRNSSAN